MNLNIENTKFDIYIKSNDDEAFYVAEKLSKYFPCHDKNIFNCSKMTEKSSQYTKLRKYLNNKGAPKRFKFPIIFKNDVYFDINVLPNDELLVNCDDIYNNIEYLDDRIYIDE